jgi:twinkle protein
LKFHGSSGINEIINTMEYAVYHYDIQNIVLDNLQFMIGMQARNTNKFDFQDEIIHRLRKFTSDKNVHVTLVIHPRKSDESLKISSIFGSAKASQEADNVYILQGYKGLRIVDVAKNRFDGTTGKTVLSFDQSNCRFFELTEKEFSDFSKNDKKIETIIEERIKAFGTIEKDSSLLYASDIASYNAESNDKNDTPKVTVTEEKVDEINSVNLETQAQTEENIKEERFVGDTISKEIISENNIIPLTNESTQDNDSLVVQITSALDLIENITKKEDVIDRIISEVNNTEEQQEIKLETKEEVIDSKENFNEKSEKNNKNEETSQITARVEENMKEVLEELKLHESSKEESELFNEKPLENKNLDNNEENNKETPEENFSQILEMSRSILPETKEIATLHTNDSKDKSQQLSYIYRINKKENFSQRYNNNYNNQHNDKQNNQYNSANFKSNNKQTKNRYNTDDFF